MKISDTILKIEQKYSVELQEALFGGVKTYADRLRERQTIIDDIEKISPLETAVDTYQRLKEAKKEQIDVVKFVERKKKVPKRIKDTYEVAKKEINASLFIFV